MNHENLKKLEETIGYVFNDKELLVTAMTHSSYSHEIMIKGKKDNNERLEFLGDAVLELLSSEFLFKNYKDMPEGSLSKLRASLVCEGPLAACARQIGLNEYIMLGKGEKQNHGEERDSILSDAFEALLGAIYLDGGMEPARAFVIKYVMSDIDGRQLFHDAKTELQMIVQNKYQTTPVYELLAEDGPPHNRIYTVSCFVNGKEYGKGSGSSKKSAQQEAAEKTLEMLNHDI